MLPVSQRNKTPSKLQMFLTQLKQNRAQRSKAFYAIGVLLLLSCFLGFLCLLRPNFHAAPTAVRSAQFSVLETEESLHSGNEDDKPTTMIDLHAPLTRQNLGHATWSLLHTTVALFPAKPTAEQQQAFHNLFHSLSILYPCHICSAHIRQYLTETPLPPVSEMTHETLSQWLCTFHNAVNKRLDKPVVDCSQSALDARWPMELGSCGCDAEEPPPLPQRNSTASSSSSSPAAAAPASASVSAFTASQLSSHATTLAIPITSARKHDSKRSS